MVSIEKRVHTLYKLVTSNYRETDFQTAFSMIGGLRAVCDAPIMALTATASSETQSSVVTLAL